MPSVLERWSASRASLSYWSALERAGEAPGELEVAVDPLPGDELHEVLARGLGFGLDGDGAGLAEPADHLG